MNFETKEELTYLAGALEYRGKLECRDGILKVRLRSRVGNLPALLKMEFGGTFYRHNGVPYFEATGNVAYALLWRVLPYLRTWGKLAKDYLNEQRDRQKANKKARK
jgi:hypothetical protein